MAGSVSLSKRNLGISPQCNALWSAIVAMLMSGLRTCQRRQHREINRNDFANAAPASCLHTTTAEYGYCAILYQYTIKLQLRTNTENFVAGKLIKIKIPAFAPIFLKNTNKANNHYMQPPTPRNAHSAMCNAALSKHLGT
jgi:hypothetical protein